MIPRTRRLAAVATVCTASLGLAACATNTGTTTGTSGTSSTVAKGGTLNILGAGDVDYMDPNISYYSAGYMALRLWSRQLFTYPAVDGQTTKAAPDLATALPTEGNGISADGKTYTFSIRQGAKWGTTPARQVTAQDMVRGVKRTCNPVQPFGGLPDYADLIVGFQSFCDGFAKVAKTPAAIAAYMDKTPVAGVTAKDDQTVVFTLVHPASYFVDMLTLPSFSPAPKEYDAYLPASPELAQHTVSDGPYKIDSYTATKNMTFSRNPAWDAATDPIRKAYVDKVVINETVSQDSIQQQLQTGTPSADLEFDAFVPPSQLPALIAKKDPNLNLGEGSSSNPYLVFNTVSPNNNKALQKKEVRQALSFGLNRGNIIQVLGGPKIAPPLTHVLPSNIVGGESNFDLYPYDAAKAKSMLAAAGYPNGLTIKMLYRNASEGQSKAFQTVQQDLSKIGVKVVGVPSPNADFYTKYLQVPTVAQRGVWDVSVAGWGADWYGDAALSFFKPLYFGQAAYPPIGSNFGFYNSAATNSLIEQASSAKTQEEAKALWAKADHQVMEDAAFYPITNELNPNYRATQVQNAIYIPAFQNFDPANVWLTTGKQGG
ncbi:ABC transporter substrate-binding protein [Pedococcus bigeumensis]|uniref:ABC transporter substrate-binding protein n=1 Tax=Pedococcus bigeumensis TaxID=433644 RepID=A0A502D158_9MICO|nr:ABC transporter substrate-binding protein [Pedococcus bigeumensis]TPG17856.1 ABC transporter substrate-binding protein [Pedococcus bigeumensis]